MKTKDIQAMADEFILWDKGTNVHTFDLVKIARKAWSLTDEQTNQLVEELDRRGII